MIFWIILGMCIVTYIPRMIPMVLTKDVQMPAFMENWLSYIPYAALGALIFPGVFMVDQDHIWIGFIAALIAFATAWFSRQIIFVLIAAVITVYILQQWVS